MSREDAFEREVAHLARRRGTDEIKRYILRRAVREGSITADALHEAHAICPFDVKDTRSFGAVLGVLAREGFLQPVGYEGSTRETCHRRPIQRFEPTQIARDEMRKLTAAT